MRSITAREGVLFTTVNDRISGNPTTSNPCAIEARAPSVARPSPHHCGSSRQPTSATGSQCSNGGSNVGGINPVNPANGVVPRSLSRTSTTQRV